MKTFVLAFLFVFVSSFSPSAFAASREYPLTSKQLLSKLKKGACSMLVLHALVDGSSIATAENNEQVVGRIDMSSLKFVLTNINISSINLSNGERLVAITASAPVSQDVFFTNRPAFEALLPVMDARVLYDNITIPISIVASWYGNTFQLHLAFNEGSPLMQIIKLRPEDFAGNCI